MADLCDADVLVHVVDATGRSDRDGNALGGGESGGDQDPDPAPDYTVCVYLSICPYVIMFVSVCLSVCFQLFHPQSILTLPLFDVVLCGPGSSPSEDAQWIREELHRWIHGTVQYNVVQCGTV